MSKHTTILFASALVLGPAVAHSQDAADTSPQAPGVDAVATPPQAAEAASAGPTETAPLQNAVEPPPVQPTPQGQTLVLPYAFTEDEIRSLQLLGYVFSKDDVEIMAEMQRRGFDKQQVFTAYREAIRVGIVQKRDVLKVATLTYLGVRWDARTLSYPVTLYYNRRIVGGRKPWIAGWVIGPIGLSAVLVGSLALNGALDSCDDGTDEEGYACNAAEERQTNREMGALLISVGAAMVATSVTLLIVGGVKRSHRAPRDLLDAGTLDQMEPYRRFRDGFSRRPELRLVADGGAERIALNATLSF